MQPAADHDAAGAGPPLRRAGAGGRRLATLTLALSALLGALALWYAGPSTSGLRSTLVALWLGSQYGAAMALWRPRRRRRRAAVAALALLGLLAWWLTLQPAQQRPWADDVAELLDAERAGSQLTLHQQRAFVWRSADDYDVHWVSRSYDLDQLQSLDVILNYWMGPHLAHTLVSFGFADGRYLTFSLEIRKQRGERFSALGGFFRRYEQVLIAADERDLLYLRTNIRHEDAYLFRLDVSPELRRKLLLAYLDKAQALRRAPAFYNSASSNCTTEIYRLLRQRGLRPPLDYRLLLSGHLDAYLHDLGVLAPLPLSELRRRGYLNARALAIGPNEDFSAAIRAGIPAPSSIPIVQP